MLQIITIVTNTFRIHFGIYYYLCHITATNNLVKISHLFFTTNKRG